ncbi:MAG TPA: DUF1664 domain-containing protein [Xenococcaceae cyanobacterium]
MATQQNSELLEIKNLINDRFNQLDRKIDGSKAELKQEISEIKGDIKTLHVELKGDIKTLHVELKGDIKALHVEVKGLDKRLSNIETSVTKIPEITEKFGELKNWRQTALIVIAGVVSAFLGWIARGSRI